MSMTFLHDLFGNIKISETSLFKIIQGTEIMPKGGKRMSLGGSFPVAPVSMNVTQYGAV